MLPVLPVMAVTGTVVSELYREYGAFPDPALKITGPEFVTVPGSTQASSVIPLLRCSEAESLTVTQLFVPLKDSAGPEWPWLVQVALVTVPVLPLPDRSVTVVP